MSSEVSAMAAIAHGGAQGRQTPLRLRVGAVVAYECLLNEVTGTTSWRVGSVRAVHASTARPPQQEPLNWSHATTRDGHKAAVELEEEEEDVMTSSPTQSPPPDPHSAISPLTCSTRCQTVLIQPWISLSEASVERTTCHHGPRHSMREGGTHVEKVRGGQSSAAPSPRPLVTASPVVRFAEMAAMQKELEEIQRFAADEDGDRAIDDNHTDTQHTVEGAADAAEERLAKTLTDVYFRMMASVANMEGSGVCPHDSTDGHGHSDLSVSGSFNEVDANPELTHRIEEKLRELRRRIEQLLAEMKTTRKQRRELQVAQESAQKSLHDALQRLRVAQAKVQEIDPRTLREIQGYRLPPAVVKLVMSAVLCVLGEKTSTWQEVVSVMRTPSFISRVALFDPAELTQSRIQELKKNFLSHPHFSHNDAMQGSQALGQFQEWVMRQVQLTDAEGDLTKFLKQKETTTAALALTRQNMKTDAAELKYLEEELDALLHEKVRQQKELLKSGSRCCSVDVHGVLSPRPTNGAEAANVAVGGAAAPAAMSSATADVFAESTSPQPAQNQKDPQLSQGLHTSITHPPTTPPTGSRQHSSTESAADDALQCLHAVVCVHPCSTADQPSTTEWGTDTAGVSVAVNASAPHSTNSIIAQQQQVLVQLPPHSQWRRPADGAVPSTYVLRSSILCVLGYQAGSTDEGADDSVFELSAAQMQLIGDAMQQQPSERPSMPLTEAEAAAAEAVRRATVTTHHTKSFDGEEWGMVVDDSAEELRRAVVEDVAAICQVPNRAVTGVEWVLGSLHVQCDVCHPASVTADALQQALEDGSYPTVMALYAGRQQVRDSLDEDATRQLQQASRLALMEEEIQAAQQAEAEARHALEVMRANFERQQQELAEQIAVAQTSSQLDCLDEAREHLALREAMQDVQAALKEKDAQLAWLQACLESVQQKARDDAEAQAAAARRAEDRCAKSLAELQRQLATERAAAAAAASTHAAEELREDLEARVAEAERRVLAAEEKAQRAEAQAKEERAAHEQAMKAAQAREEKRAKQQAAHDVAAEAVRHATVTTHHTKSFDGEEWGMVVDDSAEELRRAVVEDVAAICQVPNRAVTGVEWVLGSLHVQCDVCHPASVTADALQQALEDGSYPTVMALYAGRQQRRSQLQGAMAAAAEKDQRLADLAQQLHNATAALEEQEQRHQSELSEVRAYAAAAAAAAAATAEDEHRELQLKLAAMEKEREEARERERVANDVLKKLEVQSRKEATESEKKIAAAKKAQQQCVAEAKQAEKATAEAERKLRAAQAALQEQGKIHQKDITRLLGQLAESEKARQALQDESASAQAAERHQAVALQRQATQQKALAVAQDRVRDARAQLMEAQRAHLGAIEAANTLCETEAQRQADAAAAAAERREKRIAALEDIRGKVRKLSQCPTPAAPVSAVGADTAGRVGSSPNDTVATPQRKQQLRASKAALSCELASHLNALKIDKADTAASVAHSRNVTAAQQRRIDDAGVEVQRRQTTKAVEEERLRSLQKEVGVVVGGVDDDVVVASAAAKESNNYNKASDEDDLVALDAQVTAASQRLAASQQKLSALETQRLQACVDEEDAVTQLLHSVDASSSRAAAELMRDVHVLATSSFLQRHQTAWMNTCLCGLLVIAVASLQYKKYAV